MCRTVAAYEVVSQFKYLGSMTANSGECGAEIRRRVAMARNATTKLTKIWKTSAITRRTKLRIANFLIFPIAMYGSETWTLKESDKQRINALEMWVYRRLRRIPWTAHRTNISIIEELKIETRLVTRLNQSILRYFGHITRRGTSIERLMVEGKVEGRRSRGRSPKRWVDQVKTLVGHNLPEASHMAQCRTTWSEEVRGINT